MSLSVFKTIFEIYIMINSLSMIKKTIQYFTQNPRKLSLIDAFGALTTAMLLWFVIKNVGIDLSVSIIKSLSAFAFLIALYSFASFMFIRTNWRSYILSIATINISYCVVTLTTLLFQSKMRLTGYCYFIIEIVFITVLVNIQLQVAKELKKMEA